MSSSPGIFLLKNVALLDILGIQITTDLYVMGGYHVTLSLPAVFNEKV